MDELMADLFELAKEGYEVRLKVNGDVTIIEIIWRTEQKKEDKSWVTF